MAAERPIDIINKIKKRIDNKYKDSPELFPDFTTIKQIPVIKSPSAIINAITGVGGFPRGRVTEIYGPYSSGKTTIATEVGVTCQQESPEARVLYLDYEHAFDATYGRKLGLDLNPDRFIFAQPDHFEQGAQIAIDFVEADLVDMIVIDSAAAMTPRAQLEGRFDDEGGSQKGTQAALMAEFLARFTKMINKGRKPALVIINQTRAVINIGGRPQKNAPKTQAAGGNANKFYATIRLELDIISQEGDENRGSKGTDQIYTQNRVRVTCVKNKVAPPFMRGSLVIQYGRGINNLVSVAELAEARLGIMSGAGFFKYQGKTAETTFSCRGRDAFLAELEGNPALQKEIEEAVLQSIRDEHAASLGISEIKTSGRAKDIEADTLTLDASSGNPIQPGSSGTLEIEDVD